MKKVLILTDGGDTTLEVGIKPAFEAFKAEGLLTYKIMSYKLVLQIIKGYKILQSSPIQLRKIKAKKAAGLPIQIPVKDFVQNSPQTLLAVESICAPYDAIIFLRTYSQQFMPLLETAKKLGKIIIYMLDDDYGSIQIVKPTIGATYDDVVEYCKAADIVGMFSPRLFEKYRAFNPNTFLLLAVSNVEMISNLQSKHGQPRRSKRKKTITVGYAAGNHHAFTFKLCEEAIQKILYNFPNVQVEMFFEPELAISKHPRFKLIVPQPSGRKYYTYMIKRNWDIGLAPLPNTEFHIHKSNNKYREYGALQIAGVYSDLVTYNYCIKNEYNGLLAKATTESWYTAIATLIENAGLRDTIISNSHRDASTTYSLPTVISQFREVFKSIL